MARNVGLEPRHVAEEVRIPPSGPADVHSHRMRRRAPPAGLFIDLAVWVELTRNAAAWPEERATPVGGGGCGPNREDCCREAGSPDVVVAD